MVRVAWTHLVLALAALSYPPAYREEREEELVSTALAAASGSRRGLAREASSLVVGGLRERAREEASAGRGTIVEGGARALASLLALVNLAVALAGITASVHVDGLGLRIVPSYGPYVVDRWWISFTAVAASLVVALLARRPAVAGAAAVANLGLVAYDALALAGGTSYDGRGHLDVFTYAQTSSFPAGREWLGGAAILAVATLLAARLGRGRHRPARAIRVPLAVAAALLLVALSRGTWGAFFFLRWALLALVVLAVVFGVVAPRLAIVALGATLAALPSAIGYLTAPNLHHDGATTAAVAVGLAAALLLPLVHMALVLTGRRLT